MKKEPDYKGFIEHLEEYEQKGIPTSLSTLKKLAIKYNTPIPTLSKSGDIEWPPEIESQFFSDLK